MTETAHHFGVDGVSDMFEDKFAFYCKSYPSPDGSMYRCFGIADNDAEPIIEGVHIPAANYDVYEEVVLNLSMCTLKQLKGIICKFSNHLLHDKSYNPRLRNLGFHFRF